MSFDPKVPVRSVTGISPEQRQDAHSFLQGAVYSWCKNQSGKWFALRDLVGGDNRQWQGTPLLPLYEKHLRAGTAAAEEQAGKDAGWLLLDVLDRDERRFETKKEARVRHYRWVNTGEDV